MIKGFKLNCYVQFQNRWIRVLPWVSATRQVFDAWYLGRAELEPKCKYIVKWYSIKLANIFIIYIETTCKSCNDWFSLWKIWNFYEKFALFVLTLQLGIVFLLMEIWIKKLYPIYSFWRAGPIIPIFSFLIKFWNW